MIDPTEPIEADVDLTANQLQMDFSRMKSEQMGRSYRPADRFRRRELWLAAARKCIDLKADPYDFLRAAFRYCLVNGGPFPQQLATSAATKWYGQYQKTVGQKGARTLYAEEIQALIVNAVNNLTAISAGQERSTKDILLDENFLPLYVAPAFIRVILMPADPLILGKYGKTARMEVLNDARLGKALSDLGWNLNWMTVVKK